MSRITYIIIGYWGLQRSIWKAKGSVNTILLLKGYVKQKSLPQHNVVSTRVAGSNKLKKAKWQPWFQPCQTWQHLIQNVIRNLSRSWRKKTLRNVDNNLQQQLQQQQQQQQRNGIILCEMKLWKDRTYRILIDNNNNNNNNNNNVGIQFLIWNILEMNFSSL